MGETVSGRRNKSRNYYCSASRVEEKVSALYKAEYSIEFRVTYTRNLLLRLMRAITLKRILKNSLTGFFLIKSLK